MPGPMRSPVRMHLAAVLAAFLLALAPVPADAQKRRAAPAAISVDVGPLRAKGLGGVASLLQAALADSLRAEFGDRFGSGGSRLVVRIDGVFLATYVGDDFDDGFIGSGSSSDSMQGTAFVIGRNGQVLTSLPQLLSVPSGSAGAWYAPGNEQRRAVYLARTYAQWLGRRL